MPLTFAPHNKQAFVIAEILQWGIFLPLSVPEDNNKYNDYLYLYSLLRFSQYGCGLMYINSQLIYSVPSPGPGRVTRVLGRALLIYSKVTWVVAGEAGLKPAFLLQIRGKK